MITMYIFLDDVIERVKITNEIPEGRLIKVGRHYSVYEKDGEDKIIFFKHIKDLKELYAFLTRKLDQKTLKYEYNKTNGSVKGKIENILSSLWNYKK